MYTSYYGFSAKPFQLTPDPRFFFGSSGHKRALAYLRYGLSQSEGFIVITGGIGTGKTTLAKSLFKELDAERVIAAQLSTTQLEADDLLRLVVAAFGLPYEQSSKASLIQQFETFLRQCAQAGRRVLLVVDEAQNLPPRSLEELRMLTNFQISDTPLLQSFLLGQEGFRTTLAAPEMEQLRQRVIASCHLNPLSERETRDYIEHRLHIVGWTGTPQFLDEAYTAVYRHTRGIPRRINIFCDRLLLYGCLEEMQTFSETVVAKVVQEIAQDTVTPAPPVAATPLSKALPVTGDVNRRMLELEEAVDALLQHPEWQDIQMERLERRLLQLEPSVESLRKTVSLLAQRLEAAQSASQAVSPMTVLDREIV